MKRFMFNWQKFPGADYWAEKTVPVRNNLYFPGWKETTVLPVNTLQVFITNRCNLRCKGCFYSHKLDTSSDMSLESYQEIVRENAPFIKKITLLGGEPMLHKHIGEMLLENAKHNIGTTIYTNGRYLEVLKDLPDVPFDLRVGVLGNTSSEKPLQKVIHTDFPVKIVFMLRKDNIEELNEVAKAAEAQFNCKSLYLSSIREIDITGDFWKDTENTLSNKEYAGIVQKFLYEYKGGIPKLDISTRGVLKSQPITHCRFGNIFPDGTKIICPLDISLNKTSDLVYNQRQCNKHTHCVLQKISLERYTTAIPWPSQ